MLGMTTVLLQMQKYMQLLVTSALAMLQQVQQLSSHYNMALVCKAAVTVFFWTLKMISSGQLRMLQLAT